MPRAAPATACAPCCTRDPSAPLLPKVRSWTREQIRVRGLSSCSCFTAACLPNVVQPHLQQTAVLSSCSCFTARTCRVLSSNHLQQTAVLVQGPWPPVQATPPARQPVLTAAPAHPTPPAAPATACARPRTRAPPAPSPPKVGSAKSNPVPNCLIRWHITQLAAISCSPLRASKNPGTHHLLIEQLYNHSR